MTKEEFEGWRSIRATREIRDILAEVRENWAEQLHLLCATCEDTQKIAIQATRLQGMITGLNTFLEITWSDAGGSDEDVEAVRA